MATALVSSSCECPKDAARGAHRHGRFQRAFYSIGAAAAGRAITTKPTCRCCAHGAGLDSVICGSQPHQAHSLAGATHRCLQAGFSWPWVGCWMPAAPCTERERRWERQCAGCGGVRRLRLAVPLLAASIPTQRACRHGRRADCGVWRSGSRFSHAWAARAAGVGAPPCKGWSAALCCLLALPLLQMQLSALPDCWQDWAAVLAVQRACVGWGASTNGMLQQPQGMWMMPTASTAACMQVE